MPQDPGREFGSVRTDGAAGLYRGASGVAYHQGKRAIPPEAEEWVCRLRAEKFQPWVRETDTVFEFGVGAGWNLARLACARRVGCDVATLLVPQVKALGIDFVPGTMSMSSGSVDVVVCHQTLEHLLEPVVALREMARILRPGGRLILHVPWEVERRYAHYDPREPNHHLYHWNAQNLGNLVVLLGWRPELLRVRRYGYDRFAASAAVRWHLGERGFRWFRRLLITARPLREIELVARAIGPSAGALAG